MSKHTPGPWKAQGETISCATGYVAFATCNPRTIDETRGEGESWYDMRVRTQGHRDQLKIEIEANARLIAAAPELLEALEMLYAVVQGECPSLLDEDSGGDSRLDIAIAAAIAKAKGEQP